MLLLPLVRGLAVPARAVSSAASPIAEMRSSRIAAALTGSTQIGSPYTPLGTNEALAVLRACEGMERGAAAYPSAAEKIEAAVAAFEETVPCKLEGDGLLAALAGTWELVYSSELVKRGKGGSRRRMRDTLAEASSPQLRGVTQSFVGRQLEEEVALSLPAPFPLPRLEVCLVVSQTVEGVRFWPGKYAASSDEVQIFRGGTKRETSGRRVTLPSPRKVLDFILTEASRILPLELTLLKELEPRNGIGARREFTCTAALLKGDPRLRVLRTTTGEMQVYLLIEEVPKPSAATTLAAPLALGPGVDALEPAPGQPVGLVDASGEPVEEFWVEGESGLGPDWGV